MDFKYFKGPTDEMSNLVEDKCTCSICGKTDFCFELEFPITKELENEDKEGKLGCYSCLKDGRFEFLHDTEYGVLDEIGLTKVHSQNQDSSPLISPHVLTEMRRTPQFITWQQELWLTHCSDFMVYKGTWEPEDFYNKSNDGDGKALFMSMTDEEMNHLWDDSLPENESQLKEWYATYYVFECGHCGKLRGNWDSA